MIRFSHILFSAVVLWAASLRASDITFATPPQDNDSETIFRKRITVSLWNLEHATGGVASSVSISNWPVTQPVTGTFWQATQPVSGTFWQATQPVSLAIAPTTPVTGTFWQATQPVSLATNTPDVTDRAARLLGHVTVDSIPTVAVTGSFWQATQPVSGTFWQATQPVSLATNAPDVTDRGARLLGHVTVDSAPTTAVTGAFWQATQPVSGTFWQATQPVSVASMPTTPVTGTFWQATQPVSLATNTPDVTDRAARLVGHVTVDSAPTTAVTGSFWQATQPVSGTFWQATQPVSAPTLTKGTQGANGLSTQDLKDAGRTFVTLNADGVAGVTSNTALTFSKNVGNTVTATQTSYTITSGKTFRVQNITLALRSAAAAIAFAKVYLRSNSAGATVAASNIIWSTEINTNSATSGTGAWTVVDFPDGFEIAGDGTKSIGLSHLDQATTNLVSATLVGYEY